jgi:signal peptidase I
MTGKERLKDMWARIRTQFLPGHPLRGIWDWSKEPLAVIAVVLVSKTAIAAPYYVPSGSMEPTLEIGDAFIASKYAYGYSRYSMPFNWGPDTQQRLFGKTPARGDVVVFHLPRDPSQVWIKRVIGLPGDRIQMREARLYINGKELPVNADGVGAVELETGQRVVARKFVETLPGGVKHPIYKLPWGSTLDNTGVFVVPAHHLFMMGDDRDNSLDSRVSMADGGVGYLPVENVVGRAEFVVGSWDFPVALQSVSNWFGGWRLSRFFKPVD